MITPNDFLFSCYFYEKPVFSNILLDCQMKVGNESFPCNYLLLKSYSSLIEENTKNQENVKEIVLPSKIDKEYAIAFVHFTLGKKFHITPRLLPQIEKLGIYFKSAILLEKCFTYRSCLTAIIKVISEIGRGHLNEQTRKKYYKLIGNYFFLFKQVSSFLKLSPTVIAYILGNVTVRDLSEGSIALFALKFCISHSLENPEIILSLIRSEDLDEEISQKIVLQFGFIPQIILPFLKRKLTYSPENDNIPKREFINHINSEIQMNYFLQDFYSIQ